MTQRMGHFLCLIGGRMNISSYIPASYRKPIYGVFAVLGVIIGAIQVGFAAAEAGNPLWLNITLAVFPFVAGAVGFTASANTNNEPGPADLDWDRRTDGTMADYATEDEAVEVED